MISALERLRALRGGRLSVVGIDTPEPCTGVSPDPEPMFPGPAHVSERGYLVPDDLPESWQERYEERAAIREHHGGQAREHAEAEALQETLNAMRAAGD